jgi:cytochrome c biogenesis protein CcmG/thiol:disulfide interchange protein DsbE
VSARAFAAFMAVLAVIALLAFGLASKGSDAAIKVGEPMPDAELPALDGSGTGGIADYRGQWVLVNYWASWCAPCRDESPALESFYRAHRGPDDFTILGVDTQDNSDDGLAFAKEFHITYPLLHDGSGDEHDNLGMTGVPESVLVDPQGDVALYQPGPLTQKTLDDEVAPLIMGKGAA